MRDLGFVLSRQGSGGSGSSQSNGSSSNLGRTDTLQSLSSQQASQNQSLPTINSSKRASTPDHTSRRREEGRSSEFGPPSKRQRPASPPRDRDRDRWDGPRRRHGTPPWERERERDAPPVRRFKDEKEEDKGVTLPPVLSWFVGVLPTPGSFDGKLIQIWFYFHSSPLLLRSFGINHGANISGPVFRTDDLMQVFRNAVIPSSSGIGQRPRSPPVPARQGEFLSSYNKL